MDETSFPEEKRGGDLEACLLELRAARQESSALRDKYLRAAASIENARKQAERDADARTRHRLENLYLRLLEVADNLERALAHGVAGDPLVPGVRATREQLLDLLRREGVAPIDVEPGAPFDPGFQEAVGIREGLVQEATVAAVHLPGYTLEGRLLRPARVAVVRPPPED